MLAGTVRLVLVVIGGAAAVALGASIGWLFAVVAAAMLVFGALAAWFVARARWG